jgi:hypothetical protein
MEEQEPGTAPSLGLAICEVKSRPRVIAGAADQPKRSP